MMILMMMIIIAIIIATMIMMIKIILIIAISTRGFFHWIHHWTAHVNLSSSSAFLIFSVELISG